MRRYSVVLLWGVSGAALANDTPLYKPAPPWVTPTAIPAPAKADEEQAISVLLADQQVRLEPGATTIYGSTAIKIGTAQGLAAGNLSIPWKPDTDTLTVHKVAIHREGKTIDVLAGGQKFMVVRREANLENAVLDGVLTANLQPEGLQVGDVLELSLSVTSRDPVTGDNVEFVGAAWNGVPFGRTHLNASWPDKMPVKFRGGVGIPAIKLMRDGDRSSVDLSLDGVQPLVLPKGAPARFQIGRIAEFSTYGSWADIAAMMAPLYAKAAVLPADGPLAAEVARIRAASPDPKTRAEAALALAQDRIRYVALAMGTGGLVPASAAQTWERRYGDCKGKTALLLAMLRSLGIEAEPVAVSTAFGDGLDTRLPRVGAFNHILVRAVIAGKPYWLDGTRTGDRALDGIATPAFGWGLPIIAKGAALVPMVPAPLSEPTDDLAIDIDASGGLMMPAPVKMERTMRGDAAVGLGAALASLTGDARDRALREYWKDDFDFVDVASVKASFDPKTGERKLSMTGKARMDWSSGWYETDRTRVGYKADFARELGPDRDAPFAVPFPYYTRTVETIRLPAGFPEITPGGTNDVDRTVAGIEYKRRVTLAKNVFAVERTERSVAPEFPAKDAPAAQVVLRDLADKTLYIRRPDGYKMSDSEMSTWQGKTLTSDSAYVERGNALLEAGKLDEAIRDFDAALALNPKNADAMADRGITRVWKGDTDAGRRDLAAAEQTDPNNKVVWQGRGLLAAKTGDIKAAIAAYTKAIEIDPRSAFALAGRGQAHRANHDYAKALADMSSAIAIDPSDNQLYWQRANILRDQGKIDAAKAEMTALTKANPTNANAHVVAAGLYWAVGDQDQAMSEYGQAIALEPTSAYIYENRARARPATDRAGKRADIESALKLDPRSVSAMREKAKMLSSDRDYAGAATVYTAALAVKPDDKDARLLRGIAYVQANQTDAGERDFAALGAQLTEPIEFNNVCWAKATAGVALASALADCDRAVALAPKEGTFIDSKAFVLLRMNRVDDAIKQYDAALAASPDIPASLYGRGIAWARKGNKAKADADMAAARKIAPTIDKEFAGYGVTP